jgi:hypothetical protein
LFIGLRGIGTLRRQRQLARQQVGFEWAITKIKSFKPDKPGSMQAHAAMIRDKLLLKGFKITDFPPFLMTVLDKMQNHVVENPKAVVETPNAVVVVESPKADAPSASASSAPEASCGAAAPAEVSAASASSGPMQAQVGSSV